MSAMKPLFVFVIVALTFVGCVVATSAQTNSISLNLDPEVRTFLKSAAEDKWFKKENFASTLLGGALAITGGLVATWWAHKLQARRKQIEDAEFSNNVLRAIRRELEALQEIYDKGIGKALKKVPEGKPFLLWLGLTQEWFTVFNSNAVHLGKIEGEISRQIITVYARVKGLIEEFRINNEYLKQLNEVVAESRIRPMDGSVLGKLKMFQDVMLFQAKKIKESDQALKVSTEELFALLNQRGIK
jgi:hypothetical protein